MNLMQRVRSSTFFLLFNFHDELAKGRSCIIMHSTLSNIISGLTAGLFYTSFLMANGINIVNIGIISFVPSIASCFGIFAPSILERFKHRKWLLVGVRWFSSTLTILGVTLLPRFVEDTGLKTVLFVVLIFTANLVDHLVGSGFSVWHLQFMPERVRADFLAIQSLITNVVGLTVALVSGLVADSLAGSPYENTIIVVFRYIAYLLLLVDIAILAWPKEFPYERSREKPRLQDIIMLPLRSRKFILTVGVLWLYTFFSNIPASVLNVHLLNTVGVSYSYMNVVDIFYSLFLILLLRPWRQALRKIGWWKLFALTTIVQVPITLMYSCVTSTNYLWLMTTVRLLQHATGIGQSLAVGNLIYINLPRTDQTNYLSFNSLVGSVAGFLGGFVGTSFVAAFPNMELNLLGMSFCNVQVLQWILAVGQFLVPMLVFCFLKHLQPDDPDRIYG